MAAPWSSKAPAWSGLPPLTRDSRTNSLAPIQRSPFHAAIERGHATAVTTGLAAASSPTAPTSLQPAPRHRPTACDRGAHAQEADAPPALAQAGPPCRTLLLLPKRSSAPCFPAEAEPQLRSLGGFWRENCELPRACCPCRKPQAASRIIVGCARADACQGSLRVWRKCLMARARAKSQTPLPLQEPGLEPTLR